MELSHDPTPMEPVADPFNLEKCSTSPMHSSRISWSCDILNIPSQSQLVSKVEIVSEHDQFSLSKRLSEAICNLICGADEPYIQEFCSYSFSHKIKIDFNVLSTTMEDRIS